MKSQQGLCDCLWTSASRGTPEISSEWGLVETTAKNQREKLDLRWEIARKQ